MSAEFDERLITADRLLELAGEHRMKVSVAFGSLDCAECGQAIVQLDDNDGQPYTVAPGQMLQDTLRHLVMRHDVPLSGREKDGRG